MDALGEEFLGGALGGGRVALDVLDDVLDVLAADASGLVDQVDLDLRGLGAGWSLKAPNSPRSAAKPIFSGSSRAQSPAGAVGAVVSPGAAVSAGASVDGASS